MEIEEWVYGMYARCMMMLDVRDHKKSNSKEGVMVTLYIDTTNYIIIIWL